MHRLIDLAIDSHRVVFMVLAFIIIAGSMAYQAVPKESSPDVQVPIIYTSLRLEGISPQDAERLLIRPVEKQLRSIDNVKKMSAEATEGFASVTLEFRAGFDPDMALADVRAAVDKAKPELPDDADEPNVQEVTFSQFPIINVVLSGDVQLRTLTTLARDLRDKLEGLSSVLEAKIAGDREEMLEVVLDPLALESYGINPAEVLRRVSNNNVLIAAGRLDNATGRYSIKLPGLIETAKDLYSTPIINTPDKVVVLGDIATVRRTFKDAESFARINGQRAVGVSVSKRAGANIIDTVEAVRALVEEEQRFWPPGVQVSYSQDTSGDIRDMLRDLENNVVLAILLVLLVVLYHVGIRSSVLVAFAVPGAFLIAVLFIAMAGFTMNIVVLFSLILSAGLLVDSAIVVCEYAERLMKEEGERPAQAYARAAKRMSGPILSSTLTTLAVFMPLLFWPGIVGQFMKYMPITLIVTLTGSLLMALVFLPTIGSRLRNKNSRHFGDLPRQSTAVAGGRSLSQLSPAVAPDTGLRQYDNTYSGAIHPFTQRYLMALQWVLGAPWRVVSAVLGSVVVVFVLFGTMGPGVEFFPDIEPKNANVLVRTVGNLSLKEKNTIMEQVETRLQPLTDEVRFFYTQVGETTLRDKPEDVIGLVQLEFRNWRLRRPVEEVLADARERLRDLPGIIIETAKQEEGPPTGKALQLEFSSRFPEKLDPAVTDFVNALETEIGGVTDLADDRPKPRIEWEYTVDRVAAGRNDVSVADVGQVLKMVTNGVKINEYRPDDADDELDIMVRFPESHRTLSQLSQLQVMTGQGVLEPITNFVERKAEQAVSIIRRVDGVRVMNVKADVVDGVLPDDKVQEVRAYFELNPPDPAVRLTFRGEDEEQQEAMQFLSMAFLIAIFTMMLLLTAQFNSFYRMAVIMSAVVLSTGGVFLGALVTYHPFGIVMSGVGVISLAGIVVNNNIILIDTYDELRQQGISVMEALQQACMMRLRPILLTAGTTILGLLPMVIGLNIDFLGWDATLGAPSGQWWRQLSTAIAGGLSFATVLTLFLTPALLLLWDRKREHVNPANPALSPQGI